MVHSSIILWLPRPCHRTVGGNAGLTNAPATFKLNVFEYHHNIERFYEARVPTLWRIMIGGIDSYYWLIVW
jgi:hypothetical protein